ncbi:MAG: DAK2 domain-containing protein [Clostridia bacterium]|nr:DAK2 domain-containing protein [Clostridia bacterium]
MAKIVDGTLFMHMLGEGVRTLDANRQLVNDLNVFPIPDGDTGDNMLSTISSGFNAVADTDGETLEEVAAKAAEGMLLGARGNSGVILSRIFSGIASGFSGNATAGTKELGKAFECGVKEAYNAVSEPVEGTMLTVIRESVERANAEAVDDDTPEEYFDIILDEVKKSLKRTPELLSVLKEAGVVDSGGAGLMYIVEGMVKALRGEYLANEMPGQHAFSDDGDNSRKNLPDLSLFTEDSELLFGYCTEFLLRLQRSKVDIENFDIRPFSDFLNDVGESVVCFKEGSIIKVHVHTPKPGDILNFAQRFGEFLTLKIENMTLQHNENTPGAEKVSGSSEADIAGQENEEFALRMRPHKKFATVAVAAGEGMKETFLTLGVDAVIDGGQSMNPSAADFLKAFKSIDAEYILVFPNNGNIILTAEQAGALYTGAQICVIKTKTIGAGYSALSMLDVSSGDPDEIVAMAEQIGAEAVTAHVAPASRDAVIDGVCVKKDDFIGFTEEQVYVDDPDREEAAFKLCKALDAGDMDVILIIGGANADAEKAEELRSRLESEFKRTEFIYIDGGQPVYDYILIFE